jgi:5-methylcytosine-specific restriction endonuclease McrA
MPMRICDVCQKIIRSGGTRHLGCQRTVGYTSLLHKRMGAVYRINKVPCTECHAPGTPDNPIEAHHVVPLVRGGMDVPGNYMALCRNCNSARGSKVGTE